MPLLASAARAHRRNKYKVPWYGPLFLPGDVGMVWDFTNISTLYQDTGHATPCTAAGQPIGAIRDLVTGNYATLASGAAKLQYDKALGLYYCEMNSACDFVATGTVPAALIGNGVLTFIAVLQLANIVSQQYIPCFIGNSSPSTGNAISLVQWNDPTPFIDMLQFGSSRGQQVAQQSGTGVLIGRKNNSGGSGGVPTGTFDIWWNGVQGTNLASPVANPIGAILVADYHIGRSPGTVMNIYRSMAISRPITTTEIATLTTSALT